MVRSPIPTLACSPHTLRHGRLSIRNPAPSHDSIPLFLATSDVVLGETTDASYNVPHQISPARSLSCTVTCPINPKSITSLVFAVPVRSQTTTSVLLNPAPRCPTHWPESPVGLKAVWLMHIYT
ncbi:hypothetical protein PISMIDRAFT_608317 [Pisolithus microcarpus 441]|uniref:Uncharacterized protein n=1 Tax=Pisolithus microcarpus 441 TaxID=765257 RepID=A0A0C9YTD2_9AGAM|nr:hypothetical protein PISMIDRAFT_608317 [Pisolithus microcarpus 441]